MSQQAAMLFEALCEVVNDVAALTQYAHTEEERMRLVGIVARLDGMLDALLDWSHLERQGGGGLVVRPLAPGEYFCPGLAQNEREAPGLPLPS